MEGVSLKGGGFESGFLHNFFLNKWMDFGKSWYMQNTCVYIISFCVHHDLD